MSISFPSIWSTLEQLITAGASQPAGYPRRRVQPHAICDLFLAIRGPERRRALLLLTTPAALRAAGELPEARGLTARVLSGSAETGIELTLADHRYTDIFDVLLEDIVAAVASAPSAAGSVMALMGKLRRWQRFLQAGTHGLSAQGQQGLYGELRVLRDWLLPAIGSGLAVQAWKGPQLANQDFQLMSAAIEVKTTAGKGPQRLRITNERQLDDTGVERLVLLHLALDVREGGGETLPALVDDLRGILEGHPGAREAFDDRLLDAGYHDIDADKYALTGYTVRMGQAFRVRDNFPRIIEHTLDTAIGDVEYSLSVSGCMPFAVDVETLGGLLPVARVAMPTTVTVTTPHGTD